MTDIVIPEDTAKSKLKSNRSEQADDVATAGERIEAFWEKYPEGSILTEVEAREVVTDDYQPYSVFTVRAFIRKNSAAERPDATAHATRSGADPDEITAAFPQETAETSAVSRALKMIGILAVARKPAEPADPTPVALPPILNDLRKARRAAGLNQAQLARAMGHRGFPWTQATVSKIERGHRPVAEDEAPALRELIGYTPGAE